MSAAPIAGFFGQDLTPSDYEALEDRYIDRELVDLAGIRRADNYTGREVIGRKNGDYAGLLIPYTLPGQLAVREYRIRRDNPETEMREGREHILAKYVSPPGRGNKFYFTPGVGPEELANVELPVLIVEGEFKSLAAARAARHRTPALAFVPIGIGGVWNWRGKTGRTKGPNGEPRETKGPVPDFDLIAWAGRRVIIAFDADVATKDQVLMAQGMLKRELQRRGASVAILHWEPSAGKGLDDALANVGPERVLSWIDALVFENFDWRSKLILTEKGTARAEIANVHTALRSCPEWAGVLAYDEFALSVIALRETPWGHTGKWTDREDRLTADWCQHKGIHVSTEIAGSAVQTVAGDNRFHPVRDYLNSITWDGVGRIDKWLTTYAGAADTALNCSIGPMWLISAVARAFDPGCKVDCCIIPEGGQGIGKSTLLRNLSPRPEWFTDEIADLGSKDAAMQTAGVWIIEIAELDSMSRSESGRIKAFMSRTTDRFRPPYSKHLTAAPRGCVFAGTVNHQTYLKDETGGRRFWPVACGEINAAAVERDRDQLRAEAVTRYGAGGKWWLQGREIEEEASEAQADRFEGDPWDELIRKWLQNPSRCSSILS